MREFGTGMGDAHPFTVALAHTLLVPAIVLAAVGYHCAPWHDSHERKQESHVDKVRFLMLGVGLMGQHHILRLSEVPEAEVVGLVDPSEASIAQTRERFPKLGNTPAWSDYRQALQEVEADAAIIVTPHNQHLEHGLACLDAGLHVLMEKPFVSGSANAEHLIAHAESKGKHLAVSYQRHLQGPYLYIRNLIQSGQLGKIQFISAYQAQAWLQMTRGTWRQDPELSCGGQLNDSGSHLLDIVVWMTGLEPAEVSAYIDNRGSRVDVDTALNVRFHGGAMASFSVIGSSSVRWWEDVSVHGDKGSALYRNKTLLVAREGEDYPTAVSSDEFPPESDPNRNFVDLLLGRIQEAAAPAACGLTIARLTEAAWESARTGQPVRL
jgi:predicted dehydrogenase